MRIIFSLLVLFYFSCGRVVAERAPSVLDAWSIFVLIEKGEDGKTKVTVIKNDGEYAINQKDLERFKANFADEVAHLNQEALIYSAVFNKGKQTSTTTKVSKEFALKLRRILRSLEIVPSRK